jgi:hypothetical protein
MRRIRIHCSIDVLYYMGVLRNVLTLQEADRIVKEQPKLARKVAFQMGLRG